MLHFEFSGSTLVSIANFSSISLKMSELLKNFTFLLSQILEGTFGNFVAVVTPQNGMTCKVYLKDVSLKSESYSLIAEEVSGWWTKNNPPELPPGKIGLKQTSVN